MQRTPKHRATEKTKIVTVATGKGVKIFLVISLFVYAVISAWLIVHYSLSLKGIVLLLPGFIILSLLLYDVLVWKIKASKDGIFFVIPFARNITAKWEDLEEVYTSYSHTNHETMTLVFRNGKKMVVPQRCYNADAFRAMIISHKSIREFNHHLM